MKKTLIFIFISFVSISIEAQSLSGKLDSFFSRNVKNGLVDYIGIKKDQVPTLNLLLKSINENLTNKNTDNQKANYINIYNLLVIKQVIDNFPIQGPNEVQGFFDKNKFLVNGKLTTLNNLENNTIRPLFKDSRIHFALVCGAIGCPPIQKFGYKKSLINQQLNSVTTLAINNPTFIKIDNSGTNAKISEIFRWYNDDFGGNSKGILKFINKYLDKSKTSISKVTYYPYNWSLNTIKNSISAKSNIITYTPSALLKNGQIEVQIFNNLYTQTAWRNTTADLEDLPERSSWNTMQYTFNYGISKSGRFNLGFDINLRSTTNGPTESNSIEIFKFEQNEKSRTTISTVGPKIKWNPIKKSSKFSIQSSLQIPVSDSLETKQNRPWLDHHKFTWWTQLFFDKPIGSKFQLFTELDFLLRIPTFSKEYDFTKSVLSTPLSVFFSYFPSNKSTVYIQCQYAPTITSLPDYYMQAGLGGKYQIFPKLQLELSYTNFFAGQNNGAGSTYNVGLRYIR
jgi:hypothetical protein